MQELCQWAKAGQKQLFAAKISEKTLG